MAVRRNWVCLVIAEPEGVLKLTACSRARFRGDRFPSAGAATVREWFAEPVTRAVTPGRLTAGCRPRLCRWWIGSRRLIRQGFHEIGFVWFFVVGEAGGLGGQAPLQGPLGSNSRLRIAKGWTARRFLLRCLSPASSAAGLSDRSLRFQGKLEWRGSKRVRRGKYRGMREMRFWKWRDWMGGFVRCPERG